MTLSDRIITIAEEEEKEEDLYGSFA